MTDGIPNALDDAGEQHKYSGPERLAKHAWKPGESGNPSGRKKGSGITDRLRELVMEENGTAAKAIADAAILAAKKGDFRFFKELVDRLDGPIKQKIESEITQIEVIRTKKEPKQPTDD